MPHLQRDNLIRATRWSLLALAIAVLVSMAFVDRHAIEAVDQLDQSIKNVANTVTDAGLSAPYLFLFGAGVLFVRPRGRARLWNACLFGFLAIALPGLLVQLPKFLLGRARPGPIDTLDPYHFEPFGGVGYALKSMPSGHSCTAGALTVVLCTLLPIGRYLWIPLGLVIASTRVFTTSHYPSDVLAGYWLGLFGALWIRRVLEQRFAAPDLRLL